MTSVKKFDWVAIFFLGLMIGPGAICVGVLCIESALEGAYIMPRILLGEKTFYAADQCVMQLVIGQVFVLVGVLSMYEGFRKKEFFADILLPGETWEHYQSCRLRRQSFMFVWIGLAFAAIGFALAYVTGLTEDAHRIVIPGAQVAVVALILGMGLLIRAALLDYKASQILRHRT